MKSSLGAQLAFELFCRPLSKMVSSAKMSGRIVDRCGYGSAEAQPVRAAVHVRHFCLGKEMRYAIAALLIQLAGIATPAVADDGDLAIPSVTYPALARHAPAPEGFVPAGWRIENEKSGDLNGDGRADIVL